MKLATRSRANRGSCANQNRGTACTVFYVLLGKGLWNVLSADDKVAHRCKSVMPYNIYNDPAARRGGRVLFYSDYFNLGA